MAIRVILGIVLAILAFLFIGRLNQEEKNNSIYEESPECKPKIKTSDDIRSYTKNCLKYPKEAMDCVEQFIRKREQDPLPIALECTPNLPETVKEILRKLRGIMKMRRDTESRCGIHPSKQCANELLLINEKNDAVVDRYIHIREKLTGLDKEADEKFNLFVFKVANMRPFYL